MNHKHNLRQFKWAGWLTALVLGAALSFPGTASTFGSTLLVHEVMNADAGNTTREFIEVRNVSEMDLHVGFYTLEWRSAGNTTVTQIYRFPAGAVIPAGGYYLLVSSSYRDYYPDVVYNDSYYVAPGLGGIISTNGGVGLKDASGNIVDSVAWGNITATPHPFLEGTAAPQPPSGWSIERQSGTDGKLDHDDNGTDFVLTNPPTPTSTAYVPNVPLVSVQADPAYLEPGQSTQITATVTQTVNPITGVTIDLTQFGGGAEVPLTNTSGDTWTTTVSIPTGQASGPYALLIRANDSAGQYGLGGVDLFVYPGPAITVTQARAKPVNTGELLRVRGVVVSTRTAYAYIMDADGSAGIAVSAGVPFYGVEPLLVGQDVTITGKLTQEIWTNSSGAVIYTGEYVLTTATGKPADIVVHSSGNPIPAPKVVTLEDIVNNPALQGQYVSVTGVTALGPTSKVNSVTGDVTCNVEVASPSGHFYIAVSHNATDKPAVPYPGMPQYPIPANMDGTGYYIPWTAAGDEFNVRGMVSVISLYLGSKVIRVRDADDFVLTNNAKFMRGETTPAQVEQGAFVNLRVVGYPVRTASVTANCSALGLGTVTLTDDGTGGYARVVKVPVGTPIGNIDIPVSVSKAGQTANGSITLKVVAPTYLAGDVDRSGSANALDAVAALKVAAGLQSSADPMISVKNGDVYPKGAPDGRLTVEDSARILRSVNGLDTL